MSRVKGSSDPSDSSDLTKEIFSLYRIFERFSPIPNAQVY